MKDTLVIYHGNCPDGFGAALAAWHAFGDRAEYVEGIYGQNPPDVTGRDVVIVDFSYRRDVLTKMHAAARSLRVIDHHKSAQEDLAGLPYAEFDMEHSGAVLAWRALVGGDVPQLLLHIEDRDLWRFKLPNTHAISLALWALPRTFEAWTDVMHAPQNLVAGGRTMLAYQAHLVEQMAKNVRWRPLAGVVVPIVNATVCFSEVGDLLCKQHPSAPFAAYWFDRGDGFRQWGLRSRGGFDVSEVAKFYGGGGHAAAAGWSERLSTIHSDAYGRGAFDAAMDRNEGGPFASLGGLAKRRTPLVPGYIGHPIPEQNAKYQDDYLRGYIDEFARMHGEDWMTCEFSWAPALTVGGEKAP